MTARGIVAGIFVGGEGRRMGGVAKGLLRRDDGQTIVEHQVRLVTSLGMRPVLVGEHGAYTELGLPMLADEERGIGPLGGLLALLSYAEGGYVLALACDMPFLTASFIEALANDSRDSSILAPWRERWEPLAARYDSAQVLAVARERQRGKRHSLQGLLDAARATRFEHDDVARATRDWDSPEDMGA